MRQMKRKIANPEAEAQLEQLAERVHRETGFPARVVYVRSDRLLDSAWSVTVDVDPVFYSEDGYEQWIALMRARLCP